MERKLASVQRVLQILPIENADAIELVKIQGWQCVTRKGEFRVGDLGVYFEIDAIPPDVPPLRFLWTPKTAAPGEVVPRPAKFRIRTMKLRGALSQGLFMPLDTLGLAGAAADEDLTERLGVGKYEPPAPTHMGERRGPFPPAVPKTDEMRVQSVPAVLDELRGLPYAITLKYDGTSSTFVIDPRNGEFHVCSRGHSVRDGDNFYWQIARELRLEAILKAWPHIAVQGEIVGPGIQKNPLGLKAKTLFVFNVYDHPTGRYLGHHASRDWLAEVGLQAVATLEAGECFDFSQDDLLRLAEGQYPGTSREREGVVIRPLTERFSESLRGRLSFKVISNRYLLQETE